MSNEPDPGKMTVACPHCGVQTPLTSTRCQSCGSPLDSIDPGWSADAGNTSSGGWSQALSGVGCTVFVVIGAIIAFVFGCLILA